MRQTDRVIRFELSDDCHLRVLEEPDAEEVYGVVERNRAYLVERLPWPAEQTLEGTREFIKKTRRQLEENDGFQTAIVLDGHIVGSVGFIGIRWEARATSLGYWLAEEHQGSGLMTRAVAGADRPRLRRAGPESRGDPGRLRQPPQPSDPGAAGVQS
jgi:RimJ/RimL family protein N-acetyltransferase